jgi:hypothetical protein
MDDLCFQTVHENRIYSLKITCGDNYPEQPPTIQFLSRVNLPFVSQTDGKVDPTKIAVLAHWNRNYSLETVLVEMRKYAHASLGFTSQSDLSTGRWPRLTTVNSPNHPRAARSD